RLQFLSVLPRPRRGAVHLFPHVRLFHNRADHAFRQPFCDPPQRRYDHAIFALERLVPRGRLAQSCWRGTDRPFAGYCVMCAVLTTFRNRAFIASETPWESVTSKYSPGEAHACMAGATFGTYGMTFDVLQASLPGPDEGSVR